MWGALAQGVIRSASGFWGGWYFIKVLSTSLGRGWVVCEGEELRDAALDFVRSP